MIRPPRAGKTSTARMQEAKPGALPAGLPAVVGRRNEFSPADEQVENAMIFLPDQYKQPDFRSWLLRYTEGVIRSISHAFATAAERGIEQAAELLCDPAFYETRRQKRAAWRQKLREDHQRQEQERIERLVCPTAEQIEQQTKFAEQQLAYHQGQAAAYQEKLERLRSAKVKNISIVSKRVQ